MTPKRASSAPAKLNRATATLGTIMLSATFVTCAHDVPPRPQHLTGVVDFFLHDSPQNVKAVWIEVDRIRVKSCNDGEFIDFDVIQTPLNLLELQHGTLAQLLDDISLPVGKYCEIRLVLTGTSSLVDASGIEHELKTPSGTSSGYKVKGAFDVLPGDIRTAVNIDFDVAESVHEQGNGRFVLEPVIRVDGVHYETIGGGRVPEGEYLGYTTFTVDPGSAQSVPLGDGSTLDFAPGSVTESTSFVATRWKVSHPDIRSNVFLFSPHYRFLTPPVLNMSFQDDGRQGQVHVDYDVRPTTYSTGFASTTLPHFSTNSVQVSPCKSAMEEGFYCNADSSMLYACDGAGNDKDSWSCNCVKADDQDDGCHWPEAPWDGCMDLTNSESPYHDGQYRTDTVDIALDFVSQDDSKPDLKCGFVQCDVTFNCRDVDGNIAEGGTWKGYGNNACIYEQKNGAKTGRWLFVAHLSTLAVDPAVTPSESYSRGDIIGKMGNTGNVSGANGGYHFHVESGTSGNAAKINDAGDFPYPFTHNVLPKMPFCGGEPPQKPLDVIPPITEVPEVTPKPPSAMCNKAPDVDQQCLASFSGFSDMQAGSWWHDAVKTLYCADVVKGYTDNTYRPSNPVTRGEFLKLVLETAYPCEQFSKPGAPPFPDVSLDDDWFAGYADFALTNGIVEGKYDTKLGAMVFNGDKPILREEAAKILVKAAAKSTVPGYIALLSKFNAGPYQPGQTAATPLFIDATDATSWEYWYIYAARDAAVMSGYSGLNTFGVGNEINRAESATVVYRAAGY